MRHQIVTRAALGHTVLLVIAAILFAWAVAPRKESPPGTDSPTRATGPDAVAEGDRLFAVNCAKCHSRERMLKVLRRGGSPLDAARKMRAFLKDHGYGDVSSHELIVEALLSHLEPQPAPSDR